MKNILFFSFLIMVGLFQVTNAQIELLDLQSFADVIMEEQHPGIEVVSVPEEIQLCIVSLANEFFDENIDSSLVACARLLSSGDQFLPRELLAKAVTEALEIVYNDENDIYRRPSNKTFSNATVKNLFSTRNLKVCNNAVINGSLTVNGRIIEPSKKPTILPGSCGQYYVNGSDSRSQEEFATIQEAIDQARADGFGGSSPAQINICPGSYTENITLYDAINLVPLMPANAVIVNGYIHLVTTGSGIATTIGSLIINMNSLNSPITVTGDGSNLLFLDQIILNSPSSSTSRMTHSKVRRPAKAGKKGPFSSIPLIHMDAPNAQIFAVGRNASFNHFDNGNLVRIKSGGIIMTGGYVTTRAVGSFEGNSASVFSNISFFLGGSGNRDLFTVDGASIEIYTSYVGDPEATEDNIFVFTGNAGTVIAENNTLDVAGNGVVAKSSAPGSYFGIGTTTYPNEFAITRINENNLGTLFNTDKIVASSVDTTKQRATNFLISNNTDVVTVTTNGGDLELPSGTKNRGVKISIKNKTNTTLNVIPAAGETINGLPSFQLTPTCNANLFSSDGSGDWFTYPCASGATGPCIFSPDGMNSVCVSDSPNGTVTMSFAGNDYGVLYDNGAFQVGTSSATAAFAIAEGSGCLANSTAANAQGVSTQALNDGAHAEGYATGSGTIIASALGAHAEGYAQSGDSNLASGLGSHVEGRGNRATGNYSHAEGQINNATGETAHAEGRSCDSTSLGSHAEGLNTSSTSFASHSEGLNTRSEGFGSHSEGFSRNAGIGGTMIVASGDGSHCEGWCENDGMAVGFGLILTPVTGKGAHAEGYAYNGSIIASGEGAHAEGYALTLDIVSSGSGSHAEGIGTTASNIAAHAEGISTSAAGRASHSAGENATAAFDNDFCWSDGTAFSTTAEKQFAVKATGSGGEGIIFNNGAANPVTTKTSGTTTTWSYTPGNPADWNVVPTSIAEALDMIAAALGPI